MKLFPAACLLLACADCSVAQSLKLADFRKVVCADSPSGYRQFLIKGFHLPADTGSAAGKKFVLRKPGGRELVEVSCISYRDGAEMLRIRYLLGAESDGKKFMAAVAGYKFKRGAGYKGYRLRTGSYSWEAVYPEGRVETDGRTYYSLVYERTEGKELSAPRPSGAQP